MMKIGEIQKECKVHGFTTFSMYKYKSSIQCKCIKCGHEQRALRYTIKDKREHDLNYQEKWRDKNKEKIKIYQETQLNKDKKPYNNFFNINVKSIKKIYDHFEFTFNEIECIKIFKRNNILNLNTLYKYLSKKRLNYMINYERWRLFGVYKSGKDIDYKNEGLKIATKLFNKKYNE